MDERWQGRPGNCGCRICKGERPGPDWNDHDRQLLGDVERHGWHVVGIRGEHGIPAWAFTVGLRHTFGPPELAMFGVAPEVLQTSLNLIGDAAQEGERLAPGSRRDHVLDGYQVELRPVEPAWHSALFGYAQWFYRPTPVEFLQCVWPDFAGRFPWEQQFDEKLRRFQPALWLPPREERPGPWRAWWWASDWPGRKQARGLVFVSKSVATGQAPVLGVSAFADGEWAFVDGGPADPDAIVLEHLHHVLEDDPSLEELVDLEPGTSAWRSAPGEPWSVTVDPD